MAPEQHTDAKNADHRADIYSLGVMLYEMLVGELPVGTFEPPSRKRPGLDRRLDAIVSRCLKPAPADRYQKVSELIAELEPLLTIDSHLTQPVKAGRLARTWNRVMGGVRVAARTAEVAVVLTALGVLGVTALRLSYPAAPKLPLSEALTLEPSGKGTVTPPGRIDDGAEGHRVLVGEGPDAVPMVSWGRPARFSPEAPGVLSFGPVEWPLASLPEPRGAFGRVKVDLDPSGDWMRLSVELKVREAAIGPVGRLKRAALGGTQESRGVLALVGEPGRYVAVVLSGAGAPVALEWALQDRRGTMLGPASPDGGVQLSLVVNEEGVVRAFVGAVNDRRAVGEPVVLGRGWKRYFGKTPNAVLACVDGDCEARQLQLLTPAAKSFRRAAPPAESVAAATPAAEASAVAAPQPPAAAPGAVTPASTEVASKPEEGAAPAPNEGTAPTAAAAPGQVVPASAAPKPAEALPAGTQRPAPSPVAPKPLVKQAVVQPAGVKPVAAKTALPVSKPVAAKAPVMQAKKPAPVKPAPAPVKKR